MWQDVVGHDAVFERFQKILQQGRLASTFLFVGLEGFGKRLFALQLAQGLLCLRSASDSLEICGECESCRLFVSGNHPDLQVVERPAGKSTLPIDLFIGDREHRNKRGLCFNLSRKPYLERRKIAIIDEADFFSQESANCLLKTLEEPPPNAVLILIGTSQSKQLPTILSRSQTIRFQPLSQENVAKLLLKQGVVSEAEVANHLALYSEGSLTQALLLVDQDLWRFRSELLRLFSEPRLDTIRLTKQINEFVKAAGKEASARRERLRQVFRFVSALYREIMRRLAGRSSEKDKVLQEAAARAVTAGLQDPEQAVDLLDRTLLAEEHLFRNANQATLIEAWLRHLVVLRDRKQVTRIGE